MRDEHVAALIHRPEELRPGLLELGVLPLDLPDVAPRLALGRLDQRAPQLRREIQLPAPHQLFLLVVPRLEALALRGFGGHLVEGPELRHVPAPPAEVGHQPEILVFGAARQHPEGLLGLRGEVLDGEDEFDVGDRGAVAGGRDGAVEGGKRGDGFLAVDVVDEEGPEDVELGTCQSAHGSRGNQLYLSAVDHGVHHALGELEIRQVLQRHGTLAQRVVLRPLDVLEQAWERRLALVAIQPVVTPIAAVVEHPRLVLLARRVGHEGGVGGAVQARRAVEGGRLLAETASGWEHFLDDARDRRVLGARSVDDARDEEDDDGDARDEEPSEAV